MPDLPLKPEKIPLVEEEEEEAEATTEAEIPHLNNLLHTDVKTRITAFRPGMIGRPHGQDQEDNLLVNLFPRLQNLNLIGLQLPKNSNNKWHMTHRDSIAQ